MKDFIGLRFACNGLYLFFKKERNGRIQGILAILTIIAGFLFHISQTEWLFVLLCIGMVLSLEVINSAIEKVCNLISAEYHPQIKVIKDISAAAVLIACIISAIVATIIFIPAILHS